MNIRTIAISIAIVTFSGLATYAGLSIFVSRDKPGSDHPAVVADTTKRDNKGLKVTLEILSQQPVYAYGDVLKLRTVVRNTGTTDSSYMFSNTCVGPDIFLNESDLSAIKLCGMAFTTVTLAPNQTREFESEYIIHAPTSEAVGNVSVDYKAENDTVLVAPGTYTTTAKWQDTVSNAISITVK